MTQLFVNTEVKWEFIGVTGSTPTEIIGLGIQPFNLFDEVYINLTPGVTFSALGGTHSIYGVSGNSVFINIPNTSGGSVSGNIVLMQDKFIELDLRETEPIRFTKRSSVLEEPATVASNYTNTFIVPHTSKNGNFFKAAFNVNSYSFDATKKISAYLNIDGSRFTTGDLRLNSVIKNDKLNRIEYEVIFIGEIGSFGGAIGSKLMNQLDISELSHQINYQNIRNSWYGNLKDGNVLYPLIEWGYTYDNDDYPKQNTVSKYLPATSLSPQTRGFTIPGNPLLQNQFKPIIRVRYLFDKILKEAGFTYQSNFIDVNDIMNEMFHISTGPDTSGETINLGGLLARYTGVSEPTEIALLKRVYEDNVSLTWDFIMPNKNVSTIYDPYYIINTSNKNIYLPPSSLNPLPNSYFYGVYNISYFKIPNDGQYRIVIDKLVLYSAKTLTTAQKVQNINIYIYKNGVPFDSQTGEFNTSGASSPGFYPVNQIPFNPSSFSFDFPSASTYYTFQKDDEIEIRVQRDVYSNGYSILYISQKSVFSLYTSEQIFNLNSMFPANYKQVDFIKSFSDKFKLIWEPDPENPKNFFIEPWVNWIKSGKKRDWTNKLNENFDIIVRPVFQTQPRTTIWKDQPETDIYNYQFQQEFKKGFGEVKLYSDIEIISGEATIQTNIAPIQVAPIGNSNNFLVPHLAKDSGEKVEPIEVTPRFCFYNGLIDNPIDTGTSSLTPFTWYMVNDSISSIAQTKYPLVSNYYTLPGVTQSIFDNSAFDISWGNVKQYWEPTLNLEYGNGVTWQTAFNIYWDAWYKNTYDPYARIIEAEFALDSNDIRDLRFNDRIWIKDAWYFPLTIKDYVLNDKQNVRVELLKMGNINIQELNLNKFTLCYSSNSCGAYCCNDTIEIYAATSSISNLGDISTLYLDSTGNTLAPTGWYSTGPLSSVVYQYLNGIINGGQTMPPPGLSCSCTLILYPISVCEGNTTIEVCCCTIPSIDVYGNNLTLSSSTEIWGDPGGTVPLTPFTWYKEVGGLAAQVGADGHTVVQFNNCSGINC